MAVSEREKHEKELRNLQDENAKRRMAHRAAEVHAEVPVTTPSGKDDKVKPVEVHAFGGYVYLNSHGEKRLDQTALVDLQQKLAAAFQAVS
jgi:hypothetical protein